MPDDRSYEVMAEEHAAWLGRTVANAVGAVLTGLGRDDLVVADVPRILGNIVRDATYPAFLTGACKVESEPLIGESHLEPLVELLAGQSVQKALLQQWTAPQRRLFRKAGIMKMIQPLVHTNFKEMLFHGAKHARQRMKQREEQDLERKVG